MNVFEFMSGSPWLTFFLVYVVSWFVFRVWNRFLRMLSIRKHGWPPSHCDADGDPIEN